MKTVRITKKFSFEMAHALDKHDGLCRNIHGHSYQLYVTIIGTPINDESPKKGMIMDFSDLKAIVNNNIIKPLDHCSMLYKKSEHLKSLQGSAHQKLMVTDYNPTSENMVIDFAEKIKDKLPQGVELHSLKLYETRTSYAEWFASDN